MAKDHITDMLLDLKKNPTLFVASLQGLSSMHSIDIVDLIDNVWNLFYACPLETSDKYEVNPIFKFLAEALKVRSMLFSSFYLFSKHERRVEGER